jgi:hypothetical protein
MGDNTPSDVHDNRPLRTLGLLLAAFVFGHVLYGRFFPTPSGHLGSDYVFALPELLAGKYWHLNNGFLSIPWFTPAFCGGMPLFPDPQSFFYSLPQFLAFLISPVSAVYVTLLIFAAIGFFGTRYLLRRAFAFSPSASELGALIFALNTFFASRLIVGHLAFHAVMLLPLALGLLLSPRAPGSSRYRELSRIVGVALCGAYMVHSGMLVLLLPVLFTAIAMMLLHRFMPRPTEAERPPLRHLLVRTAGASALMLALSANKLMAAFSMLHNFPRNDYPLPGLTSIAASVELPLRAVFFPGPDVGEFANANMTNSQWLFERHEFEFGLGPAAALILCIGLVQVVRLRAWRLSSHRRFALLLLALLAVPIALNIHSPAWHDLLKSIPLLGASSSLFRWYLLYIPIGVFLCAWILHAWSPPWSRRLAPIIALALLFPAAVSARSSYLGSPYDATPVTDASDALDEAGAPPVVSYVQVPDTPLPEAMIQTMRFPRFPNDGLIFGVSNVGCYNPIFGYRLEHLPLKGIRAGRPDDLLEGRLNFKNPACYVWPEANGCEPGDHFHAWEALDLARLAAYQPFAFKFPTAQRVANALTVLGLALVGGHLVVGLSALFLRLRRWRARRAETPKALD